jgi:adenosylmethionine-8-amino-7-oxononanoate aminotransferase
MSHILHRHSHSNLPEIASGDGVYLVDTQGKRYLDACGGAAVSCLGHSNQVVKDAIKGQIDKIPFAHTAFFTSGVAEQLAEKLLQDAPANMSKVYFVTGGSEANETALKLARQYFVEIGEPQRKYFIAREQSYHGNTIMTLAIGGNQWRKQTFKPILPVAHLIPPCYAYRYQAEDETEQEYALRSANELENKILELGAENVIGFIAEPVVGATAGVVPPAAGYFKRIRDICDQYGVLLIADEIMCGMGRCGTRFTCTQEGFEPDIITIAKGLGGCYQPLGGTLLTKNINDAISSGSGFFQHGHTYLSHPSVCAAALAVQQEIDSHSLLDNVNRQGKKLIECLRARYKEHPNVGDIRGRGLFIGVEFVADKSSKKPFSPDFALHTHLKKAAMDAGLMIYPGAGTIDGQHGHHVLIAPSFIFEDQRIDEFMEKFDIALSTALNKA